MRVGGALILVWWQALVEGKGEVALEGKTLPVRATQGGEFRALDFVVGTQRVSGVEQNPETGSRGAQLPREGRRMKQFKIGRRHVANVCEGKLLRCPAWQVLGLSE